MNVLSLFDGMACGRVALDRANLPVTTYYASEIEPESIAVAQANWPDIRQLGDVRGWRFWNIDWSSIDLVIGGSPCQGFSSAGSQQGLDDPRSALFWEFAAIRDHVRAANPAARFLLENVKMRREWLAIITGAMGVEPIFINSDLVSAQSRQRFYWTDIPGACVPEDKGLVLHDLIEGPYWSTRDKSYVIDASYQKGSYFTRYFYKSGRQIVLENGYDPRPRMTRENCDDLMRAEGNRWRILTPSECEALQTLPPGYTAPARTAGVRYRMIGNGWTVDVIAHLMQGLAERQVSATPLADAA